MEADIWFNCENDMFEADEMAWTADFETTTDPNDCRVWAYGLCNINNTNQFIYGNNLDDFIKWCKSANNPKLYFHNLKFDGEFIIYWLFKHGYKHVYDKKDIASKTFTTLISDMGQFYSMSIYFNVDENGKQKVDIYDSLKIIPFSVDAIAKDFDLKIQKLEIDYDEKRKKGHILTIQEIDYLKNDVTIVAKALNTIFAQNLRKMTQGSNALHDYKTLIGEKKFKKWYPTPTYDSDIRQSYKGGWVYVNPIYKEKDVGNGIVLDVNSLYPAQMYNRPLPFGEGIQFSGEYKPDNIYNLYIQMIRCQFDIKPDHLPTIQIRHNNSFSPSEYLESSDDLFVTLCLTNVDLELFFQHYNVYNVEYMGGWKFKSTIGLFKDYIDKWYDTKMQATRDGNKSLRTLAKLMLNALYGKFALNPKVQSKIPYLDQSEDKIKYHLGKEETRKPIYVPIASFITAWGRYTTITAAQSLYDRFLYADTDSLHLLDTDLPSNLEIDPYKLGAWGHESTFTHGRYLRQKCYAEEIEGQMHITCAGMPTRCYPYVNWENFVIGNSFEGKLQQTHVSGGIVLKDIDFTLKR